MKDFSKMFILFTFVSLSLNNCRNDELSPGGFLTPTGVFLQSLVIGSIPRGGTTGTGTSSLSGYEVPRNGLSNVGGAAGLLLFGTSFQQPAVWRNGNGTNWEKSTYTIPGCVSGFIQDGSNTCQVLGATFNGFSKYYVLVRYSESRRGSDNVFRDSGIRFWLGTGTFLSNTSMTFRELNLSSLGIFNPENSNATTIPMAAISFGVVIRAENRISTGNNQFNTTYNYCASTDDGVSWSCISNSDVEFVENLDSTTISIGRASRWTNSGAPVTTGDTRTRSTSAIRVGNRSFLSGGGGILFTDTTPLAWINTTSFTLGNNTSSLSGAILVAGASDTPFAVNRTFSNNAQSFTLAKSADNGVSWTTSGSPNTGFSYTRWETFSMVFRNGKYTAVTGGTESSGTFGIRILETTIDPTLGAVWSTICGGQTTTSGNATCP